MIALINPLQQTSRVVGGGGGLFGAIACALLPAFFLAFYPGQVVGAVDSVFLLTMTALAAMCATRVAFRLWREDAMGVGARSVYVVRKERNPWR